MRKQYTPREYQPIMTDHVLDVPRCGVWAGMGLGKTASVLTALDILHMAGYEEKPALIVAPLRVAQSTWPDEARKWEHLRGMEIFPIVGPEGVRTRQVANAVLGSFASANASAYTINYENLPWLIKTIEDAKLPWPFGMIIADESTKLKGFRLRQGTQRAKALARVAHTQCSRFVELTGTPSPNGLQDLWGQAWFLDAGIRLGRSFEGFKNRWFHKSHDGYGIEPTDFAHGQITAALGDLCISLDAADYFDLREPIVNMIEVELPARARELYDDMEKRMFMELEGHEVEAFNAAARTQKCLQICNGAAYVGEDAQQWKEIHDVKIQALEDIIEEAAGMPVLVSYEFRSDLARLQKAFPRGRMLDKHPDTIREWNAGKIPILFTHPASAGHGLNLQDGGNILAFFGHNWNLELYQQILERIGPVRQLQAGYNRPVFIHHIVARDTIEESVIERLAGKREVQDLLLEAMKRRQK